MRAALLSMADLLASLESVLSRSVGISGKLHAYLGRIDEHMNRAAREREERGVKHTRGVGIGVRETPKLETKRNEPSRPPTPPPAETVDSVITASQIDPALFDMGMTNWNYPLLSDLTNMASTETFVSNPTIPANNGDMSQTTGMQIRLPEELQADWPFGTNEAFDFLGNW